MNKFMIFYADNCADFNLKVQSVKSKNSKIKFDDDDDVENVPLESLDSTIKPAYQRVQDPNVPFNWLRKHQPRIMKDQKLCKEYELEGFVKNDIDTDTEGDLGSASNTLIETLALYKEC